MKRYSITTALYATLTVLCLLLSACGMYRAQPTPTRIIATSTAGQSQAGNASLTPTEASPAATTLPATQLLPTLSTPATTESTIAVPTAAPTLALVTSVPPTTKSLPSISIPRPTGIPTHATTLPTSAPPTSKPGEPTSITIPPTKAPSAPIPTTAPTHAPGQLTPTVANTGSSVADFGFRPNVNGFSFANYGAVPGRTRLTPAEVRRMFGDQVCASLADGECILTPPAEEWMDRANGYMSGGQCEGMAALSVLFYTRKEEPNKFEAGASKAFDLEIDNNATLQREIAYWFATQLAHPTVDNEIKDKTPSQVLDILISAFKGGASAPDTYTMGIYKLGYRGGHSITPYAVEDNGNDIFSVLVYDNNHPNTVRRINIDRNANTWTYVASTNPNAPASEYKGDATTKTLTLTRTSARLKTQICSFCATETQGHTGGKLLAPFPAATQYNQVWLGGEADLLISDGNGRRTGYVAGNLVNDIPGVQIQSVKSDDLWVDSPEPVYNVPTGVQFTISVDGTRLTQETLSSVAMIGPGYDLAVDDIFLDPGQKDTITFSPDGQSISYKTDYNESPDIILGLEASGADYAFLVRGVDIENGSTINLHLDQDRGRLSLSAPGNTQPGLYSLEVDRIGADGEETFSHDDITLEPDDTIYVDYLDWQGEGTDISVEVDEESDGTIDETVEYDDEP